MYQFCPRPLRPAPALALLALLALGLAACGGAGFGTRGPATPAQAPEIPATIRAEEVVGRWGYAAFHRPDDRARTETAARNQCRQPYVISAGQAGGVIMHLADQNQPQELRLKGATGGRNFIGPAGPAGGPQDREVVTFDGRVMILRFVESEVAGRYGMSVYVRCTPRA